MKYLLLLLILNLSISGFSQAVDSIFTMDGKVLPVKVTEITDSNVKYKYPGEDFSNTISKSTVQKIKFRSGRIQEFAPSLNVINVKSCLDWENVQISKIESEVIGLMKIDNVGAKARGNTTMSSLAKLQSRTYNKVKIETAMLGGNVCFIIDQNTEEAVSGFGSSKPPSVTLSALAYTSKKVYPREVNFGDYKVTDIRVLRTNKYNIDQISFKPETFKISKQMLFMENNFPKLKLTSKNIDKINEYTVIFASKDEMVLSGVYSSRKGKKTYYNIFLKKD